MISIWRRRRPLLRIVSSTRRRTTREAMVSAGWATSSMPTKTRLMSLQVEQIDK